METVAVLQLISSSDVLANLLTIEPFLETCKQKGIKLLVVPENFSFMGFHERDKWSIAELYNEGLIQDRLSQWAKHYNLWIVAGTMPMKGRQEKVRSTCLVFDNYGKVAARYDKIHLFDVSISDDESYRESDSIEAGSDVVIVDSPVGRLGLSVCYDLRFAELYRELTVRGAQLLAVPSAFTFATGEAHWEVLLRARAIENLCYVLAANQGGVHENGRQTYGHSMIIAPWGNVLAKAPEGINLIHAKIDLNQQAMLRIQFPCLNHHKL